MREWVSPDRQHRAIWRWGGEMWMSGPEWGYLNVDGKYEFEHALCEALWSQDSQFLAFVTWHDEAVPNRKGVEGLGSRVAVLRLADGVLRYCIGNVRMADIRLESFVDGVLRVYANSEPRQIRLDAVDWPPHVTEA